VQDSKGNEENRYPDPDSNKTKMNYTKESNQVHLKKKPERRNSASNQ
jgi:hypothetical protein